MRRHQHHVQSEYNARVEGEEEETFQKMSGHGKKVVV